jgi:hypothetical protein
LGKGRGADSLSPMMLDGGTARPNFDERRELRWPAEDTRSRGQKVEALCRLLVRGESTGKKLDDSDD